MRALEVVRVEKICVNPEVSPINPLVRCFISLGPFIKRSPDLLSAH